MTTRKTHLNHPVGGGPVCQRGRIGGGLRGEHLTTNFAEFRGDAAQCSRCKSSFQFRHMLRKAEAA